MLERLIVAVSVAPLVLAPVAAAQPGAAIPGDGIYVVGRDISPGVYLSLGNDDDCYWARLAGLTGDFEEIIANGGGQGQQYVRVLPGDVAFETSSCTSWNLAGNVQPTPAPARSFPQTVPEGAPGPRPADACADPSGVTQDAIGQTMWCNPTMTGDHRLLWMYGGDA